MTGLFQRQDTLPPEDPWGMRRAASLGATCLAGLALVTSQVAGWSSTPLRLDWVGLSPLASVILFLFVVVTVAGEFRRDSRLLHRLAQTLTLALILATLASLLLHPTPLQPLTFLAILCGTCSALCSRSLRPLPWLRRQLAAVLGLVPLVIGGLVLVSFAAGAPSLYGSGRTPMSLLAAFCSVGFGLVLLLRAGWDTWPLATFSHRSQVVGHSGRVPSLRGLALFLAFSVLVLGGGSLLLRSQLQATRGQALESLSTIADLKAHQIADWTAERRSDAQLVLASALLQDQLHRYLTGAAQAPPEAQLRSWLAELQKQGYQRVALFDALSHERIAVPEQRDLEQERSNQEEVQIALQAREVWVRDLHEHADHPNLYLGIWIPIRALPRPGANPALEAKADGALLLMIDPRRSLFPLVQSWPNPSPSAETVLTRGEGQDLRYLSNPSSSSRGGAVLEVRRAIPGTPWTLQSRVDEAEVFGPLRERVWVGSLAMLGLLTLLAAGLGLRLRDRDTAAAREQLELAERYAWLMREANDMVLLLDGQGRIIEANAQAEVQYGFSLAELQAMSFLDLRPAGVRASALDQFRLVRQAGSQQFEALHQHRDGTVFPVEISARCLEAGGELKMICFIRDITERRAQQRELQRMTQMYAAQGQVNQAIVRATDRQQLFDRVCQVMVQHGRFAMAWIGWDDPATHVVQVAARCGDVLGVLDHAVIRSDDSPEGQGAMGSAIRLGCPCILNDFMLTPEANAWLKELAQSGLASVAAFPISQGGQIRGALAVYATEKEFFGVHEAALLEEAATEISYALDHLAEAGRRLETEGALRESERFLLEAQEAGGVGIYTWFIQEDLWTSSPNLDRIFGIGPDYPKDLQGWTNLVDPDFRGQMNHYVLGIIERHERFALDYPIQRVLDGARRWVHGQGEIQYDAEDRPVVLIGVIQDITERKLVEASLRKISVAVEQSPLSIVITDPHGTIEYVNPGFSAVTGFSAQEAIGRNPRILKSGKTPPEQYRAMWETLARGEVWRGEFQNRKKDGNLFHERETIAPVRDLAGVLTNFIAIKEDISSIKVAREERRLLEAQLQQSQKLESLGSLAGGVAHDMNNVMGAILGLASTLHLEAAPGTASARNLDTIISACLRGRDAVKSLLYFAQKDLQEERPSDLNEIARDICQLLAHTLPKQIKLVLDLDEGLDQVMADGGALGHALMNLCVNAMDAMPTGGSLLVATGRGPEDSLILRVRDSGEGMTPEVLTKAMEPFFTTKPQGKGTGLGLAMVYGTMKAHEGALELHSEPGIGTEARLCFPASRKVARADQAQAIAVPVIAASPCLKILLVDDDDLIREAVAPMLEALGHTVETAPGGEFALRTLALDASMDLVILDMNMPGMSGAETLPQILALYPGLPVIMATGYSELEIAPLLAQHPEATSLRKPFSLKEVDQKIADLGIKPKSAISGF